MILLVAVVVILCSIFGFTYSRSSLRSIQDGGARLSTIRLPEFMHRTPLIQQPQGGVEGDAGNATIISQHSLDIDDDVTEEISRGMMDGRLRDDRNQLERRIIDQKIRDAKQIGLITDSLWPQDMDKASEKIMKNPLNMNSPEMLKLTHQKINTHTIFNMIQYETFKEAMAVLRQEEEEEAARVAEGNLQHIIGTQNEMPVSNVGETKNLPEKDENAT